VCCTSPCPTCTARLRLCNVQDRVRLVMLYVLRFEQESTRCRSLVNQLQVGAGVCVVGRSACKTGGMAGHMQRPAHATGVPSSSAHAAGAGCLQECGVSQRAPALMAAAEGILVYAGADRCGHDSPLPSGRCPPLTGGGGVIWWLPACRAVPWCTTSAPHPGCAGAGPQARR